MIKEIKKLLGSLGFEYCEIHGCKLNVTSYSSMGSYELIYECPKCLFREIEPLTKEAKKHKESVEKEKGKLEILGYFYNKIIAKKKSQEITPWGRQPSLKCAHTWNIVKLPVFTKSIKYCSKCRLLKNE